MIREKYIFVLNFGELLTYRPVDASSIRVGTKNMSGTERHLGSVSTSGPGSTYSETQYILAGKRRNLRFRYFCLALIILIVGFSAVNLFLESADVTSSVMPLPKVIVAQPLIRKVTERSAGSLAPQVPVRVTHSVLVLPAGSLDRWSVGISLI